MNSWVDYRPFMAMDFEVEKVFFVAPMGLETIHALQGPASAGCTNHIVKIATVV